MVLLINKLEKQYKIKIKGNYIYGDIKNLECALKLYYPQEIKLFLNKIVFVREPLHFNNAFRVVGGIFYSKKLIKVISGSSLDTINHELAHGRIQHLPTSLVAKWKQTNIVDYADVKKFRQNKYSWKNTYVDVGYGFFSAYGSTCFVEDVATAVEFILKLTRNFESFRNQFYSTKHPNLREYTNVYFSKLRLLYQYGFILRDDYLLGLKFFKKYVW